MKKYLILLHTSFLFKYQSADTVGVSAENTYLLTTVFLCVPLPQYSEETVTGTSR